jgi:hypothetical protein
VLPRRFSSDLLQRIFRPAAAVAQGEEEIAWVLRTDARKKRIGFVHARDLKPRERYVLPDLDDDWS